MKIIKSKLYMEKEAIWSLPVGDPGLPGQLTEKDIDNQFGGIEENEITNREGESDIDVNWLDFGAWYSKTGEQLSNIFLSREDVSPIHLTYTYSYDRNEAYDIKPINMLDYTTNQTFTDLYLIQSFADYYEDKIKSDINISENM